MATRAENIDRIALEFVTRTDPRYVCMRERHYIPNKGAHGQQFHFLVWDGDTQAGIISAGSGVYSVAARDQFFGIPSDRQERERLWLPAIVNNTVFRLEASRPNLGSMVLSLWTRTVAKLWPEFYGVPVLGFETFVIPSPTRQGSMYLAANWELLGETAGRTKTHTSAAGMAGKRSHADTEKKLIFARWNGKPRAPSIPYKSCWRRSTPEEKAAAKNISTLRSNYLGRRFTR